MPHTPPSQVEGLRAIQNTFAAYTLATKTPSRRRRSGALRTILTFRGRSRRHHQEAARENAVARVKPMRSDHLLVRLVAAVVREGAAGILEDPADLLLHRARPTSSTTTGCPTSTRSQRLLKISHP